MTVWVRRAIGKRHPAERSVAVVDHTDAVVQQLALASEGHSTRPNSAMRPLLEIQQRWSAPPTPQTLVAEVLREGCDFGIHSPDGRRTWVWPTCWSGARGAAGAANLPSPTVNVTTVSIQRYRRWTEWLCCRRCPRNRPSSEYGDGVAPARDAERRLPGHRRSAPGEAGYFGE
jgi:hypothetical protein